MQCFALLGLLVTGIYVVHRLSSASQELRQTIRHTEKWHRLRAAVWAWSALGILLVIGLLVAGGLQWYILH